MQGERTQYRLTSFFAMLEKHHILDITLHLHVLMVSGSGSVMHRYIYIYRQKEQCKIFIYSHILHEEVLFHSIRSNCPTRGGTSPETVYNVL